MTANQIKALCSRYGLQYQHSAHGGGRYSIQIFRANDLVAEYATYVAMPSLAEAGLDDYDLSETQFLADVGAEGYLR